MRDDVVFTQQSREITTAVEQAASSLGLRINSEKMPGYGQRRLSNI